MRPVLQRTIVNPIQEGTAARAAILRALEADLVGPFAPDAGTHEDGVLSLPPSCWYLTGFLAPLGDRETRDATADQELAAGSDPP